MQTLKKILFILNPRERKQAIFLLIMVIIMALFDMIGIASILPFIAVLTNPQVIETNDILNSAFVTSQLLGIESKDQFIFCLGILVFLTLIIGLGLKAFTTYLQVRFTKMREYSISKLLVESYLRQPYVWFLNRNSADLGKSVLSEAGQVAGNGIKPIIDLLATGVVVIAIITLLLLIDIKLALTIGITFGIAYGLVYNFTRNYLNRIGEEKIKNNQLRFMSISEAFGASKEIKVGGLEQIYIKRFNESAKKYGTNQTSASVIAALPRFAFEGIAFGGVMLLILYLMLQKGSFNNALPIISLYIFAGYRLMPALQQMYYSLTEFTFIGPSLDLLYKDIKSLKKSNYQDNKDEKKILSFSKKIQLRNVNYKYPKAQRTALNNINLTIFSKTSVGLVGPTGCGKTSTVDVILGLLNPQQGTLEVDEQIITEENKRAWQRSIGYVPQHIYLADDTLTANIAFGINPKDINQATVEYVSKIASLHDFVENELPDKYQTIVGERGVRLSGGQRQRIGIARALYHEPKLLILDEATSALDNLTEKAVMDAVHNSKNNITKILVAHRLSTVRKCDKIFFIEKGEIKNEGTFEELIKVDENFRSNANI